MSWRTRRRSSCRSTKRSRVTLPKNLITAPCRNFAVVVLEIPLPPIPVHAEIEGRRSAATSGQNNERVEMKCVSTLCPKPPRCLLVFIGSSKRFIFLLSIRLITAQLIQSEAATFIKQDETAYLTAVKLSPLSSRNWNVIDTTQK
jgi:hypothetical protein